MLCAWFVLNKSEISNQRNTNNQYVFEFWCVWNALRWVPVKSQKPQKKKNTTFLNSSVWNALTTITAITTITTTSTTITTTIIKFVRCAARANTTYTTYTTTTSTII